jgi:energy-converting hydrogenase A subunit M
LRSRRRLDMARVSSIEALEHKIEKAQEQVSRTKKQYDTALATLSDLLDKRDAIRRDELVKAIMKSDRTYEEVLAFLSNDTEGD